MQQPMIKMTRSLLALALGLIPAAGGAARGHALARRPW